MNLYYVNYPRDFANEYTVYVVDDNDAARLGRLFPEAKRITRAEAIRLGKTRPAEARRDGEQWFGGFAQRNPKSDHIGDVLWDAQQATVDAMDEAEYQIECRMNRAASDL